METPEYMVTNERGDRYLSIDALELHHICVACAANRRFIEPGNTRDCTIPLDRKHHCLFVKRYRGSAEFAGEMELVLVADRLYTIRTRVNTGVITKRDALWEWGEKRAVGYNDLLVDAEYQRIIVDGDI
ncbi:MAG: hypothetical protein PHR28_11880 [candidate division Zixibacteria bacterium]|jgi:hypothetical protein|nr:hypothetical protein [candidate division Zixibacteria bacterium]